jgi:hypothetical protein
MSSVIISGDTSGAITVSAPAVAGTNTLTLQAATATNAVNTLATAVASTSGTSIDFTGLPSWIKRITVMFSGVSTNGTSNLQIQIGAGSVTTSGYTSGVFQSPNVAVTATTGIIVTGSNAASYSVVGSVILTLQTGNSWVSSGCLWVNTYSGSVTNGGSIALGGTLDRVRITTVNGTDAFDAGTINILYEG